ncbi:DUF5565 family protein [Actinomadura sp. NPDC023710]|uniref:RNA ligase 1 family protein n=1 Tax=Actinomadura sp. NPDC023710 TaxID=3158219 RepID=UPI003409FB5D
MFAGEGRATRKLDGTCTCFDGQRWWARREVKPGKTPPPDFQLVQVDDRTGKRTGWEPMEQSSYARWHAEALAPDADADHPEGTPQTWQPGTYELWGPKIGRDPEGFGEHVLIRHGSTGLVDVPLDFDGLAAWLLAHPYEGIVWHHKDGRMAKLKRKDMPAETTGAAETAGAAAAAAARELVDQPYEWKSNHRPVDLRAGNLTGEPAGE